MLVDSVMVGLTPRQKMVLRILIREYIASATPIGSSTIKKIGRLEFSTATIRNELVLLEELGYIVQPYTSAGRIPTVKGYRYFVEQLMQEGELTPTERRMIQHQFHQIRLDQDQWMRLTAAVLAHTVPSAALVTAPHATSSRLRHVELISIRDTLCLMILVLQDGSIHQEFLTVSNEIGQSDLSQISNKLNALVSNHSLREIQRSKKPELVDLRGWQKEVLQCVLQAMRKIDRRSISDIYRDGLVNVLSEPEFDDAEKSRQVVEMLEHRGMLEAILLNVLEENGIQIIIGGEVPHEEIYDVSLVLSPYGIKGKASGVLGVIGPTRIPYSRAISTVRYVAQLMDGLIDDVYGV